MEILNIYRKIIDETFSFYKENNHITYSKNINMAFKIYSETVKKTNSVKDSKLLQSMENILEDFFKLVYNTGDIVEVLNLCSKFIDMLMESLQKKKEKVFFPLIFDNLFKSVTSQTNNELVESIGKLLLKINHSNVLREEEILRYNFRYFKSLVLNEKINVYELENLKRRFLNNIVSFINYGKSEELISIEIKTLYYILKDSIINLRENDINILLNEVFVAEKLSNNGLFQKISTVFHFYVYYLTVRESDIDSKTKEELKIMYKTKIYVGEKPFKKVIEHRYVEELWKLYPELYDELINNGWEIMPINQVKTLKIHRYINEYFLFYSLYLSVNQGEYFEAFIFEQLEWEKMLQLYSFFGEDKFLKEEHFDSFVEFLKLIDASPEFISEQLELQRGNNFGEEFIMIFKGRLIKNAAMKRATFDISSEFDIEREKINKHFEEWAFKDLDKAYDPENIYENVKIKSKVTSMTLPINYFERNTVMYGMSLAEGIVGNAEIEVMKEFERFVKKVDFNYKESRKITKILDLINKDIEINSVIVTEKANQRLKYTESLKDLSKMEEKLSSINNYGTFINASAIFYFNSNHLSVVDAHIDVQIRDLNSIELNEEIQKIYVEKDKYKVDIGYGIEVSLENEEVRDYYANKFYKLDVILECRVIIGKPKIGYLVYII